MLNYITWNVDPEIFSIGPLTVRWYGLLWAAAILVAWEIVKKIFKYEKHPEAWADKLFIYGTIGLIVGARLGHCLFYDPVYYLLHPWEMLYIWEGGLASHGGAVGLLIAMYFYNKKVTHKGFVWMLDRLVIGVAVGGALIRLGNLMNSEIYGGPTTLPWGFRFVRDLMWHMPIELGGAGELPCHPTQIYEMLYCLITFAIIWWMYWKKKSYKRPGLIFGVFLIGIFGTRFLLEFIKFNQVDFEATMFLNMGQWLSVPFIIWGIYLIIRASRMKPIEEEKKKEEHSVIRSASTEKNEKESAAKKKTK
ncbi:prolipoprotein diacylglyceryl transferase [Paludibacter sp. 221]|uniref:prolipoprotein diacylglyceryl transferase n=1 Tax=Paludibacter sp. 221 TaxID=2302939 RepID=UPI0013D1D1C3|nr:prolipoprotein diacylglyceryl transferase [Paludibacter sp. 221]NDV46636.1 prolipoprotein diacylglyceryl transferase [Paludibacter sp. 221]